MRRTAGAWLRKLIRDRRTAHGLFMMLTLGYVLGAGVTLWTVPLLGGEPWLVLGVGVFMIGAYFIAFYLDKDLNRVNWPIRDMEKGAGAEEAVGQLIERAITREGCAVAHHVKAMARYGDIDHLVATPNGLWVVETKSGRIPRSEFHKTLQQIKANVDAAKRWAPDIHVQGCLVFGGESIVASKRSFSVDDASIRCFSDPSQLVHQLLGDESITAHTELSQKVWKLADGD